jgi:hypothetical protein
VADCRLTGARLTLSPTRVTAAVDPMRTSDLSLGLLSILRVMRRSDRELQKGQAIPTRVVDRPPVKITAKIFEEIFGD